ncbi:MAG: T9SS type A sorting domain-containing protein [Flavobacteriales bacterium]|nr:T9SS type A sorting domain-containing protein [Flavobacteriales bacterium]
MKRKFIPSFFSTTGKAIFRLSLTCVLMISAGTISAQLSGTYTVPGSYPTLAAAVADLNTQGVGAGGVIINVSAGHTETLGARISLTATGTAANPIIIQKSGVGANPLLTAFVGTNLANSQERDGMLSLEGSDWVTVDGIDFQENPLNSNDTERMEYAIGLFKASADNGSQNNTIKNCTITLSRDNQGASGGVWHPGSNGIVVLWCTATSNTGLTPTLPEGTNSFNKFYSNTIQNTHRGISFISFSAPSPFTLADTGNDVGGSSLSTGNIIRNFGGSTGSTLGTDACFVNNQWDFNFSNNTINNNDGGGANHPNSLYGVWLNSSSTSASANINNNTITLKASGTTQQVTGIYNQAGSTPAGNTININNNTLSLEYNTATTGAFHGIWNAATPAFLNMNNNVITGMSYGSLATSGTGVNYGIHNSVSNAAMNVNCNNNSVQNISRLGTTGGTTIGIAFTVGTGGMNVKINNNVVNNLTIDGTGTTSTLYGIQASTGNIVVDSNTVSNLSCLKTSGTGLLFGIYNISSPVNENYNYNTIFNIIHNGTGTTYGINTNTVTGTRTVSHNTIYGISTNGTTVAGMVMTTSSPNVFKNKIYDVQSTSSGAPTVSGIILSSLGTAGQANIYNNYIGDIKAPNASTSSATSPTIRGINITGTTANSQVNVSFNTVVLNASSTGANFGTTALWVTTSTTATTFNLTLRNNILVNNSVAAGTGFSTAYQRSSTALANYNSASNRNLLYAGVPSASNLIFYDGTNADQTINDFKTRVASADANSITENPNFLSLVGSAPNFLHINPSIATQIESGADNITGIVDDFDGDIRAGNPGYTGTGSSPDIGADEGEFLLSDLSAPQISYTPLSFTCSTGDRTLTAIITDASGVPVSGSLVPRVYYNKNGGAWFSQPGTLSSGNGINGTWTFAILASDLGSLVVSDVVNYYVIAQDIVATPNISSTPSGVVATDVNTVVTHPATSNNYSISPTLSGIYSVGVSGNYTTLTAAANAYNTSCLSGPVVFELIDASYPSESYPITINNNNFASAVNTLSIRPAAGNTALISGNSTSSIILLNGADFVTIDGSNNNGTDRSLTLENTATAAARSVITVSSLGTNAGATNNTIKNIKIIGGSNTAVTSFGIHAANNSLTNTAAGDDNDNLLIENNEIWKVHYGIYVAANATGRNDNLQIVDNIIGSSIIDNYIGNRGITVAQANGSVISKNEVFNIINPANNPTGIFIGTGVINTEVTKNYIHDLAYTGTGGYGSKGINIQTNTANSNLLVSNNMIANLNGDGWTAGIPGDINVGIIVGITTSQSGIKVYNNSINLYGDQPRAATATVSTGIYVGSNQTNIDIRNNILSNGIVNPLNAGAKSYAIYSNSASSAFSNINHNNYYAYNSQAFTGFLTSDRATLANWQTATGQDANSVNIAPVFTSATDLHLPAATNISLIDLGTVLAEVTDDIDGDLRGTTPDMGADEFANYPMKPNTPLQDSLVPSCTNGTYVYAVGSPEAGVEWYWQTSSNGTDLTSPATDSLVVFLNDTYYIRAYNATLGLWSTLSDSVVVSNIASTPITISPAGPITICQGDPLVLNVEGLSAGAPAVITQWNFNTDLLPTIGAGSVLAVGGTTQTLVSGAGSTDLVQPGQALNTTSYPAQNTGSGTAGTQFNISTAGYTDLSFSFDIRLSNTAANTYLVQYNPDITNGLSPWISVDTLIYSTGGVFINNQVIDFSVHPAANNNPNLGIRVVSAFDLASGTSYVAVNSGSTYGTGGTARFDMVTLTGSPFDYTFLWNTGASTQSITPTASGTYSVLVTSPNACPGNASVDVTINPTYVVQTNPQICDNQTFTLFDGTIVSTTGTYFEQRSTVAGCDSIIVVNLTVNPTYNNTVNTSICSNETYTLANGTVVTTANTYVVTVPSVAGCDSTVTVNLTVLPAQLFTANETICANETFQLQNGTSVNTPGTYTVTFASANGCDSTFVTNLTVLPVFTSTLNPVICANQSYTMPDGTTSSTAGTYVFPFNAINGCDSTITVNLTVNPIYTTNVTANICPGGSYTLANGTVVNTTDIYTVTVPSVATGCDSTVIVDLTVRQNYNVTVPVSICQGQTYTLVNGATVSTPGNYTAGTSTIYGCDSVVTVTLTVNPVFNNTVNAAICADASYLLPDGNTVNQAGTYTSNLQTVNGCDSIIVTNLTVNPLPVVNLGNDIAVPNPPVILNGGSGAASYLWNTGATSQTITVTQNGTYSVTVTNSFGCTASDEVNVNFTASIASFGANGGSVDMFPNPASDRFTIQITGNTGNGIRMDILNAVGQVVSTEWIGNASETVTFTTDVQHLAAGTYFVRLTGSQAEATLRLIIAK